MRRQRSEQKGYVGVSGHVTWRVQCRHWRLNVRRICSSLPLRTDLNHFCLVLRKDDMPGFIDHLKAHGVMIEEGPATRWGAHGTGMSVYFCDPEKRRIEVRYYDN